MQKLTALEVRNVKGPCRLPDGRGLFFEITPSGVRRWIYRYKIGGKGGRYTIGRYPKLSLAKARKAHEKTRDLVRLGVNPSRARRAKKQEIIDRENEQRENRANSFEYIALEWIEQQRGGWSKAHGDAVLSTLQNNVFGALGSIPVDCVKPPQILAILQAIESRGSLEIARKVLQRMNAVFRYAVQTGRATYNPAGDMKGVLKTRPVQHLPALFDSHLAQLLHDISVNTKIHIATRLALQFTAITACRSGEVRGACWSEIDSVQEEWHIPAERMKMKRPHIVPLSGQAMAVATRAGVLFGTDGLLFPSARDSTRPMSDNTMSKALRDMGYRGKATPHGFRSSFSSMAYEKSGFPGEVIEKCLAHEEKNRIKAAYNRAEYLEQRRQLMQWWGNEVQMLEEGWLEISSKKAMNE